MSSGRHRLVDTAALLVSIAVAAFVVVRWMGFRPDLLGALVGTPLGLGAGFAAGRWLWRVERNPELKAPRWWFPLAVALNLGAVGYALSDLRPSPLLVSAMMVGMFAAAVTATVSIAVFDRRAPST